MVGQPFEPPTGLVYLVDLRISVPGGREREFLPVRGPFRGDVQARQRNERPSGAGDQIQLLNLRIIPFAIRHKRQPPPIRRPRRRQVQRRSEEHTSELQSQSNLVCRLLLEKKKKTKKTDQTTTITSYKRTRQHCPMN